jgi:hypothetical protein
MKIKFIIRFICAVIIVTLAYGNAFADEGVWVSGTPPATDATLDELNNVGITADGNLIINANDDGVGNEAFIVNCGTGGGMVTPIMTTTSSLTLFNTTIDVNGTTTNLNGTSTNITSTIINLGNAAGDTTNVSGPLNVTGITTTAGITNTGNVGTGHLLPRIMPRLVAIWI